MALPLSAPPLPSHACRLPPALQALPPWASPGLSLAAAWPQAMRTVFQTLGAFPMSALFDATALIVPFEKLRMSDVEAVGGKNASLGEMISAERRKSVV